MSIDKLTELIHKEWDTGWAQKAEEHLKALWTGDGQRYPSRAGEAVSIRCPDMGPDKNVPYAALIHPNNPSSGRYGGDSFAIFPRQGGPAAFGLVVGTAGLAPDEEILGQPGHARKAQAIARWLGGEYGGTRRVSWAKHDPTRTDQAIPKSVLDDAGGHRAALKKYEKEVYSIFFANGDEDATRQALKAYLDLTFAERGIQPLKGWEEDAASIRSKWMREVLPQTDEDEVKKLLDTRKYVVLAGPPGTGKTHLATKLLRETYCGNGRTIQFHPNTTYENFIGGLAPKTTDGGVGLTFQPTAGQLMVAVSEALANPDRPYLLHIDEINRADLAKVLGEAIFLLEPREVGSREVVLPYDFEDINGSTLRIPRNLHIIGTMNTADRSIAIVDVAVRRRFAFVSMWPDEQVVKQHAGSVHQGAFRLLMDLFVDYATDDAFNLIPGHSYFMTKNDEEARLSIKTSLVPLLREYIEQGYVAGFAPAIEAYIQRVQTL